jgi:hypothetical protein
VTAPKRTYSEADFERLPAEWWAWFESLIRRSLERRAAQQTTAPAERKVA